MAHLALYVLRILFFRKKRPKEIEKKSGKSCWPSYHPLTSRLLTKNCGANSAFQGQSTKAPSSFRCPYLRPEAIFTFFFSYLPSSLASSTRTILVLPTHLQSQISSRKRKFDLPPPEGPSLTVPEMSTTTSADFSHLFSFFPTLLPKTFFFSKIYLPPFPPPSKCAGVLFYLEMAGRQRERQKKNVSCR